MKFHRGLSLLLLVGIVFSLLIVTKPIQARPLGDPAVALQVESISGPDEEGAYRIKGFATPSGLQPDPNASFSNYLSVYAEFMGASGQWPIFYEFYSLGWACNAIGERCLTEEENDGINVQSAGLVSINLDYEDDGKPVPFDATVMIPEGAQQMRIIARLQQTLHGNPWDMIYFRWAEHGPVAVTAITPQPPEPDATTPAQDSGQTREVTPTPIVADLNIDGRVALLQAIEGTNLVADRDVGVFVSPIWDGNVPSPLPPIQVTVTIDGFELATQTKTSSGDFGFIIPANRFNVGDHQIIVKAIHIGDQVVDPNPANNVFAETVTAHSSRPMRLLFTRVQPRGGQVVSIAQLNQLAKDTVAYLRQVYPVPRVQRIPSSYYVLPGTDMRISVSVAVAKTLVQYNANRCLKVTNGVSQPDLNCQKPKADLAIGAVPRGHYGEDEGWLFGRGSSIWGSWFDKASLGFGWVTAGGSIDRAAITVVDNFQNPAHEIGHHFNLEDEYSSASVGKVIPTGIIWKDGRFVDIGAEMITYYNFMGNAGVGLGAQDYWVNVPTWNHILAEITSDGVVGQPNKLASLVEARDFVTSNGTETVGSALLVAGSVNQQGQGTIYSVDQLFQYEAYPNAQGSLRLEARSAAGELLGQIAFDTYPFAIESEVPFLVALPVSDLSQVAEVRLYEGETQLASQVRSANTPATQLNRQPDFNSNSLNLSWTAQDADGDALKASVYYSTDGGNSWQVIVLDTSESNLTLDPADLPGGITQFRVVVSDGFNETQILSDPVNVADRPPSVKIQTPWGTTFPSESAVILQGFADDLEDGDLPDDALIWTDQNNQVLGSGPILHTNRLLPGQHQITLTASDSAGGSAQASVTITLEDLPQTGSNQDVISSDETWLYGLLCLGLLCVGLVGIVLLVLVFLFLRRRRTAPSQTRASMTQDAQGRWWSQEPSTGAWYLWDGRAWQPVQTPPQQQYAPGRPPRRGNAGAISCLGALGIAGLLVVVVGGFVALIVLGFIPEWQPTAVASPDFKDLLLTGGGGLLLSLFGVLMVRGGIKSIITRRAIIEDDETGYRREVSGCSAIFNGLITLLFGILLAGGGIGLLSSAFFQLILPWLFPVK
jgi:hypothetical protein